MTQSKLPSGCPFMYSSPSPRITSTPLATVDPLPHYEIGDPRNPSNYHVERAARFQVLVAVHT